MLQNTTLHNFNAKFQQNSLMERKKADRPRNHIESWRQEKDRCMERQMDQETTKLQGTTIRPNSAYTSES